MRSRIDMVSPSYSNFSIGITFFHHNGTTACVWVGEDTARFTFNA